MSADGEMKRYEVTGTGFEVLFPAADLTCELKDESSVAVEIKGDIASPEKVTLRSADDPNISITAEEGGGRFNFAENNNTVTTRDRQSAHRTDSDIENWIRSAGFFKKGSSAHARMDTVEEDPDKAEAMQGKVLEALGVRCWDEDDEEHKEPLTPVLSPNALAEIAFPLGVPESSEQKDR